MNRHPLVDYSPSDILTNAGWRTTEVGVDMTDPSSATSVTVLDFKVEAEPRGQRHVKLFRKDFDTISESRWPFIRLSISRIFQSSVTISPERGNQLQAILDCSRPLFAILGYSRLL